MKLREIGRGDKTVGGGVGFQFDLSRSGSFIGATPATFLFEPHLPLFVGEATLGLVATGNFLQFNRKTQDTHPPSQAKAQFSKLKHH